MHNCPSFDLVSAADPLIAFYVEENPMSEDFVYKGKTEAVKDSPNHIFLKTFTIPIYQDTIQRIRFKLFDVDNFDPNYPLEKHQYVGYADYHLNETMIDVKQRKPFRNDESAKITRSLAKKNAGITVRGEPMNEMNADVSFTFQCVDIDVQCKLIFKLERSRGDDYAECFNRCL